MTTDIVLADQELLEINGAVGATTVVSMITSAIEAMTPASLIPVPSYSQWSFGPNAGSALGGTWYGFY